MSYLVSTEKLARDLVRHIVRRQKWKISHLKTWLPLKGSSWDDQFHITERRLINHYLPGMKP